MYKIKVAYVPTTLHGASRDASLWVKFMKTFVSCCVVGLTWGASFGSYLSVPPLRNTQTKDYSRNCLIFPTSGPMEYYGLWLSS